MRLPRSLHWRIALAYTVLIFLSLGIVSLYLVSFVRDTYIANLQSQSRQAGPLRERQCERERVRYCNCFRTRVRADAELQDSHIGSRSNCQCARVTVIGTDGRVTADSLQSPTQLPSQVGRSEKCVPCFRRTAWAASASAHPWTAASTRRDALRRSADYIGSAGTGGVVGAARVAVPSSQVQPDINRIIVSIAVAAVLVGLLSVGAGYFLFRHTSRSVRAVRRRGKPVRAGRSGTSCSYRVLR